MPLRARTTFPLREEQKTARQRVIDQYRLHREEQVEGGLVAWAKNHVRLPFSC